MSANAEKISTLRLPGLIGLAALSAMSCLSVWSLRSWSGVTLSISSSSSRRVSRSFHRSRCQDSMSMSSRSILIFSPNESGLDGELEVVVVGVEVGEVDVEVGQ